MACLVLPMAPAVLDTGTGAALAIGGHAVPHQRRVDPAVPGLRPERHPCLARPMVLKGKSIKFNAFSATIQPRRSLLARAAQRIVGLPSATMAKPQQFHHKHFRLVRLVSAATNRSFARLRVQRGQFHVHLGCN